MANDVNSLNVNYITSERLRLVPATQAITEADMAGAQALSTALGVDVPDNWPPEHSSRQSLELARRQLRERAARGWSNWYLVGTHDGRATLVGVCGFKSRPDESGSVEIAYSLLSQFHRRGLATEAVARLVEWAFTHPNVNEVSAETLPHLAQSIAVLRKNGFSPAGPGSEHGVVRYAITRKSLA